MKSIYRLHAKLQHAGYSERLMPKQKTPTERLAALQEQMKAAKNDLKAAERKRCEIIGAAVITLLNSDADFKAVCLPKIRTAISSPRDKAAIETLLV
jgi:hypothetical protein